MIKFFLTEMYYYTFIRNILSVDAEKNVVIREIDLSVPMRNNFLACIKKN